MIKLNMRLMAPTDGNDGGGGGTATNPADATQTTETQQTPVNPYNVPDTAPSTTEPGNGTETQEGGDNEEYALTGDALSSVQGDERAQLTELYKKHGISADVASAHAGELLAFLRQQAAANDTAADTALRQTWGKNFDANFSRVNSDMSRKFAQAGLTPEERQFFECPMGYAVWHKLMGTYASAPAVGTTAPTQMSLQNAGEKADALIGEITKMEHDPNANINDIIAKKKEVNNLLKMRFYALR